MCLLFVTRINSVLWAKTYPAIAQVNIFLTFLDYEKDHSSGKYQEARIYTSCCGNNEITRWTWLVGRTMVLRGCGFFVN